MVFRYDPYLSNKNCVFEFWYDLNIIKKIFRRQDTVNLKKKKIRFKCKVVKKIITCLYKFKLNTDKFFFFPNQPALDRYFHYDVLY